MGLGQCGRGRGVGHTSSELSHITEEGPSANVLSQNVTERNRLQNNHLAQEPHPNALSHLTTDSFQEREEDMNSPSCQVLYLFTIFHMRISESLPGPLGFLFLSLQTNKAPLKRSLVEICLSALFWCVVWLAYHDSPLKCPYSSAFYYYYHFFFSVAVKSKTLMGEQGKALFKKKKKKPSWFTSCPPTAVSRMIRRLQDILKKAVWEYLEMGVWWRAGLPAEVLRDGFGAQRVGSALQMFTGTPPASWMGQ